MDTTEHLIDQLIERTIQAYKAEHLPETLTAKDKRLLFIIIKLELGDLGSDAINELHRTADTDRESVLTRYAQKIARVIADTFIKYQELSRNLGDSLQALAQASVDIGHPELTESQKSALLRTQQRRLGLIVASL